MGQTPSKFDNYEVGELLGEGAFGRVYRATHRTTGDIVALKMLEMYTEELQRSSGKGIRPLRKLGHKSHAHIVKYIDYFEKDESLWLVMEYCSQGNLNEFLLGQKSSKDVILRLMKEIAEAVRFLHDNNIVHGNLKPDNILLSGNYSDPVVKVSDFGLAKVCGVGDGSLLDHYGIKSSCSTLFLAPEVIRARVTGESYGMYSDVFSMGVIFVAMVDGQRIGEKLQVCVQSPVTPLTWNPIPLGLYLCYNPSADLSGEILKGQLVNEPFKLLIVWMLQGNYLVRPVASDVLEILNTGNVDIRTPESKNDHNGGVRVVYTGTICALVGAFLWGPVGAAVGGLVGVMYIVCRDY